MQIVPKSMHQITACLLAATVALPAMAGFRAEVVRSEPIVETYEVKVPREVCHDEEVAYQRVGAGYSSDYGQRSQRSRTPGVVGAIIGGAIGHSVGHGKKNKKIGTAVGAILGGTIGADISRRNHNRYEDRRYRDSRDYRDTVSYRTEQVCRVTHDYRTEERIRGYDVTYVYAGETYDAVLDHDPGRYLDVNVRVTPAE